MFIIGIFFIWSELGAIHVKKNLSQSYFSDADVYFWNIRQ